MPQLPTGTLTFLFTDIERSTHLLRQLRERYSAVLADHRRLLRAAFVEHGGQEMNTEGDAFFVVFRRAKDAVGAAAAAQRALAAHAWPDGLDPRVRMGVSTGEPGLAEDEYFGLGIHLADRVCSAAHGGQVLISQSTYALVQHEEVPGIELRRLGEYLLKDFDRPEALYDLIIDGLPSEFPPPRTLDAQSLDEAASATMPAVPTRASRPFSRRTRNSSSGARSSSARSAPGSPIRHFWRWSGLREAGSPRSCEPVSCRRSGRAPTAFRAGIGRP
jgi:class 3 adenylate cyclase